MFNGREADEEEERKKHEGTKVSSREGYRYSFIGRRGREEKETHATGSDTNKSCLSICVLMCRRLHDGCLADGGLVI